MNNEEYESLLKFKYFYACVKFFCICWVTKGRREGFVRRLDKYLYVGEYARPSNYKCTLGLEVWFLLRMQEVPDSNSGADNAWNFVLLFPKQSPFTTVLPDITKPYLRNIYPTTIKINFHIISWILKLYVRDIYYARIYLVAKLVHILRLENWELVYLFITWLPLHW